MLQLRPLLFLLLACGLALAGCNDDRRFDDDDDDGSGDSDSDTDSDTDSETELDTCPEFDCDALSTAPISLVELNMPRGFHDVAFDDEGHIVGTDGTALLKVTHDDELTVFVPGMSWVQGMDYLPGGDLVLADGMNGQILRIDPGGVSQQIASSIFAYGVIVGPDGQVYVADDGSAYRIDPDTQQVDILVNGAAAGFMARTINFSPDLGRMYIGTHDGYGEIFYLELDADLEPVGEPVLLASGAGGVWQDGLGVDACGNIYTPVYDNHTLYRVTPTGQVQTFYTFPDLTPYGHGLEWGTGEDGWSSTALYLPQPYDGNTVLEMEIGVPSRQCAKQE